MRRQRARYIDNGHFQRSRCRLSARCARRCARQMQIVAMYIRIDEHGQVSGIDATLEVLLVHLHQIMVALLRIASEMMPHQIIDDALRHALGAQEARIETLIAPFDPA